MRVPGWFYAALAIALFALHTSYIFKSDEFLTINLTHDDTYYYLLTAWNHKSTGFPSFDGVSSTNGFHFLWYLIVHALSYLANDLSSLLRLSLLANSLFLVSGFLLIYRYQLAFGFKKAAPLLAVLWFANSAGAHHNLNGMESPLHITLNLWIALHLLSLFRKRTSKTHLSWTLFTVLLVLNAWTRLDAGLCSAILFTGLFLFELHRSKNFLAYFFTSIAPMIILAILGACIQFASFYSWNSTIVPVSGLIKMAGVFPRDPSTFIHKAGQIFVYGVPQLGLPYLFYPASFVILAVVIMNKIIKQNESDSNYYFSFLSLLAINTLGFCAYYTLSGAQEFIYWYFTTAKVFWMFVILGLIQAFHKLMQQANAPLFLAIFVISYSMFSIKRSYEGKQEKLGLYKVRYHCALWVRDNLPPDARIAAWNAGQTGYFSQRATFNLDGLVNSKSYFKQVLLGNRALYDYFQENGIRYIVDYYDYTKDKFLKDLQPIKEFPVKNVRGDGKLRVWDLSDLKPNSGYYPKK